jgi:hypothetical protein
MSGFENDVVYAKNADFSQADNQAVSEANGLATNGQMWIGTTAVNAGGTHINVGAITSPLGSLSVGYVSPNITLDIAGGGTFVQSISGGPGVTITGTALNPIVNSVVFTDTTATTLAVDNGYFATAAGTYNMPATAAQGEVIEIVVDVAGVVVLDCPALNFIRIGNALTSSGGTATSSGLAGDALKLRYRASSLTWESISVIGNWVTA